MKYATVCSGIEAPSVAWHPLGWEPVFFSEISPFPSALLSYYYPNVQNLGDMTKIQGENYYGSVDVFCGGTPCQSFSLAGLRKGLDDPRGNLMLSFVGIAAKMRPRWIIWENVPGVLSSNKGRDFSTLLGALGELGYGFAYRILDAQFFGVAQRRRRVFVVGYFGDWRPAAAVLFEPESLRRHFKASKKKGENFTAFAESSLGTYRETDIAGTLKKSGGVLAGGSETFTIDGQFAATLTNACGGTNTSGPKILSNKNKPLIYDFLQITSPINKQNPKFDGPCYTLAKSNSQYATALIDNKIIRRLTPVECERLQGFPDNYTNIPYKGKSNSPDSVRYAALGNSMAVPVMHWLGQRIDFFDKFFS